MKPVKQKMRTRRRYDFCQPRDTNTDETERKGSQSTGKPGGRTFWKGSGIFQDTRDQKVNDKMRILAQLKGGGMVVNKRITRRQSL